jgi:hypothetical protein
MGKKLFDYVIGNPPYQDETLGDNKGFAPPVYDKFLNSAFETADAVEMIHPARFLFNAGSTPKAWNEKMLSDPHFKVLYFEQNSSKVFPNTDIKGGVAITYYDARKDYGEIGVFTAFSELNTLLKKTISTAGFTPLSTIIVSSYAYHFTDELHTDYPSIKDKMSKGHQFDLKTNVLEKLTEIFTIEQPLDGHEYIQILGRVDGKRTYRFVRRDYITKVKNLDKYKVFLAKANGSGALGEVMSTPLIGEPLIGSTESFLSIGSFETLQEAEATEKYVKSKFARCLLGVLKTTQDITPDKWKYVPLQDFTKNSDIDWSKSIHEIDLQLYRKYGLDENEIEFIETHVKEMA